MVKQLSVRTRGQGLQDITRDIDDLVVSAGVEEGLCTVFVRHTSASLVIQENADPSARQDLERWLNRLVPEGDPFYTHDAEGPDDMPSHLRSALTATQLSIPVKDGALVKYEFHVTGTVSFNGNDFDSDRDTTVEIKDVGATKVEVPEAAKKKLS